MGVAKKTKGLPSVTSCLVMLICCGCGDREPGRRRESHLIGWPCMGAHEHRLWPVVGDVFDQLNQGFRQEEVNVLRLSVRTSL